MFRMYAWHFLLSTLVVSAELHHVHAVDAIHVVDRWIQTKLDAEGIEAAPICDDYTFLRRLTLATTGQLPSVEDIKQFVADRNGRKREDAIERLLAHPLHASVWATRMCEIHGSRDVGKRESELDSNHEARWHAWFRARFAHNQPYDSLSKQILVATSREEQTAMELIQRAIEARASGEWMTPEAYAQKPQFDLFWQRTMINEEVDVEAMAERVSAAFLGVRIECAKCHAHPFDRWTQDDYRSFSNIFSQVRFGMSPETRAAMAEILQRQREESTLAVRPRIPTIREVYLTKTPHDLRGVSDGQVLPPRALDSDAYSCDTDRRQAFADWLTQPSNPYFAKNFVNRVWEFYFGTGLVNPVDAFSESNPPTHPELLDDLSRQFIEYGYDIRRLEYTILSSHAWQRSADLPSGQARSDQSYAAFRLRILPGFAVVDSIACALDEAPDPAAGWPAFKANRDEWKPYFEVYLRSERKLRCDCERQSDPSLRQSMLLLSDPGLNHRIEVSVRKRMAKIPVAEPSSNAALIDELFLSTLSRLPSDEERQAAMRHVEDTCDQSEGYCDLIWSMINTREFITLH